MTRWKRDKGASKVFQLKAMSQLPAQSVLFSVTANKVQMIKMIIQDLLDHKDDQVAHKLVITGPDPVPIELPGTTLEGDTESGLIIKRHDLRTIHEEADTIIVQQV